jgi:hypothetical protein
MHSSQVFYTGANMKVLFAFISACHKSRQEHVRKLYQQMYKWEKWGLQFDWQIVFGDADSQKSDDLWIPVEVEQRHFLSFQVDDTRRWMALKNQELFKWALEHGYDHVFRACDDSIVYPHRYLAHTVAFRHDYIGTMCGYGRIAEVDGSFVLRFLDYMHGGVGIGLSAKAMRRLVDDKYPGPDESPLGNEIHILPNQAIRGGWGTYWDDLWIGEVLRGHLPYADERRENTYYNYADNGIEVYDNPKLFASNFPIDFKQVIAHHSLDQMGTTDLTPGPFSTVFSKAQRLTIPYDQIDETKINLHQPDEEARQARQYSPFPDDYPEPKQRSNDES